MPVSQMVIIIARLDRLIIIALESSLLPFSTSLLISVNPSSISLSFTME